MLSVRRGDIGLWFLVRCADFLSRSAWDRPYIELEYFRSLLAVIVIAALGRVLLLTLGTRGAQHLRSIRLVFFSLEYILHLIALDFTLKALTMSDEEARSRWEVRNSLNSLWSVSALMDRRRFQDLHNHVTTQTAQAFVTSFLTRCVRANTEHTASLDDPASSLSSLPHLSPSMLVPKYKYSQNRIVLVDFEGTLWRRDLSQRGVLEMLGEGSEQAMTEMVVKLRLPEEVEVAIAVLGKLAEDKKNEVWLLSGLRVKGVLEAVAERVPQVGIV